MTWVVVLAIIIDRFSKFLCQRYLAPLGSVPLIEGVFHLTYVQNTGAAFGMFQGANWLFIPVIVLTAAFLIYLMWTLRYAGDFMRLSIALILGGALGNLMDRVMLGYVVDFLDFRVWPVFNIADSCIVIGSILLGYRVLVKGEGIK